jgi:hypothetical protein
MDGDRLRLTCVFPGSEGFDRLKDLTPWSVAKHFCIRVVRLPYAIEAIPNSNVQTFLAAVLVKI